ncbi:short-chain dehydrogenase [Sistotremastrum suecicum HHB10207 ss-3]|uniref:Short-chain dehydrogenase n=1 Tax=Sistotremastrum suecicum HHB10207 ss-3 TaxID=1314776 RepID=A0A165Z8R3_9AGAM|nr:short-chain dehydrogenase [Sistotremastrum suecicum HHB10207 ss-3]
MAPFSLSKFISDQMTVLPSVDELKADLSGKTVIVVGANTGLGLEAARHFASMNPERLILACRTPMTAYAAVDDIKKTAGCQTVEFWPIDLTSFASVSAFATRFEKEGGGKLDILVENAGIASHNYNRTRDGVEATLQTNHLASALLALLLLPSLSKATNARITIVSCDAHYAISRLPEADSPKIIEKLNEKNTGSRREISTKYRISKLLNVFFTRALAEHLPAGSSITVDSVNPGLCHSELTRSSSGFFCYFVEFMKLILGRSTEAGSRTLVHAALAGHQESMQGRYLNNCRVGEESDFVLSSEGRTVQERVWKETVELLEEKDERVRGIVEGMLRGY